MKNICWLLLLSGITFFSCKKSKFLDENPNKKEIVPTSIDHFQQILDYNIDINNSIPELTESAADDYYWQNGFLGFFDQGTTNVYTWNDDIWYNSTNLNYNLPYNVIFTANVALEGAQKIESTIADKSKIDNVKGCALFLRAFYTYQLAQLFCLQYTQENAKKPYGVPLRLSGDVNEKIMRSTVQQTYDQIIADLRESFNLLPETPQYKTRPSKSASFALLARTFLVMGQYDSALKYSDACLNLQSDLLDYNNPAAIIQFNKEVIWPGSLLGSFLPTYDYALTAVDTNLYNAYHINDLRKERYYEVNGLGGVYFKGSYEGTADLFGGIAVDEVYLIRAECFARMGEIDKAMKDLNLLMHSRWKNNGSWVPFSATTSGEAVDIILRERRKELVFRGIRWSDIRRLNAEGRNIQIKRILDDGSSFILVADNNRFTYQIPPGVINFHPEMPQTPR